MSSLKRPSTTRFDVVRTVGLTLPDVEATTNWARVPVLRVRGCFMAGIASHRSAEPDTLVVRCAFDDRERLLEDAPETYYVTDYYRPYPVVLARLPHLTRDALRDLLSVSCLLTLAKARNDPEPRRRRGAERSREEAPPRLRDSAFCLSEWCRYCARSSPASAAALSASVEANT